MPPKAPPETAMIVRFRGAFAFVRITGIPIMVLFYHLPAKAKNIALIVPILSPEALFPILSLPSLMSLCQS